MATKQPKVGQDVEFLVLGMFCWGVGNTEAEAKKKARAAGGSNGVKNYFLYLVPKGASVNSMGGIEWKQEEGEEKVCVLLKYVKNGKEQWPLPD